MCPLKVPTLQVPFCLFQSVIIFGLRFAFFTHISGRHAQFQNMCAIKRNDLRQLNRCNFRVEKCKTEDYLSKFLNNMAYKTVTKMRDCFFLIKFYDTS